MTQRCALTARELEVLGQAARGLTAVEAARESSHAASTVRFHRKQILRKLGARNFAHAVALAFRAGLLDR